MKSHTALPDPLSETAVLIVAAGRGARAGGGVPKQYRPLAGLPVLTHTLRRFREAGLTRLLSVINPDDKSLFEDAAASFGADIETAMGGDSRAASVLAGLEALAAAPPAQVLIHDGARPLTTAADIAAVLAALDTKDGAVLARPMSDTVKRGTDGLVAETVPRDGLWRAETPQGFRFQPILNAYRQAERSGALAALTDDASAAEAAGLNVALVAATGPNLKITTADDFRLAAALLQDAAMDIRTGTGFDAHAFTDGDAVTLCGVEIPHAKTLAGHSDADVALHALVDAILGALGEGDIGDHFPPSDDKWKGAPSRLFVEEAARRIAARGGTLMNADITIICEAPRLAAHKPAMRASVALMLGVEESRVNIKATTTEKMGFTGRGEGIAAQAAVSLRLPEVQA